MLPFLAVIGGAAAVELKNQITGDRDVNNLQRKQRELEALVKEVQKQLEHEREQVRDLVVEKTKLQNDQQKVQEHAARLEQETKLLLVSAAVLHQREKELAVKNEQLAQEKELLQQQVESLSSEKESTTQLLEDLRGKVGDALEQFAKGELSSETVLAKLHELGVDVHCEGDGIPQLTTRLANGTANDAEVGLQVDDSWKHKLRLVFDSPDRAAKLIRQASMDTYTLPSSLHNSPRLDFMRTPSLNAGTGTSQLLSRLSTFSRLSVAGPDKPKNKENMVPMLHNHSHTSAAAVPRNGEDTSPFVKFVEKLHSDATSPAIVFAPQPSAKQGLAGSSHVPRLRMSSIREGASVGALRVPSGPQLTASSSSRDMVLQ